MRRSLRLPGARGWAAAAAAWCILVSCGSAIAQAQTPPSDTLRVLQWNIAQGWGTDGQSNIDRVVSWIVQMNADLISLNEVRKSSSTNQCQIIADKLRAQTGQQWYYHWVQLSGASTGVGVAVMSRFPLLSTAGFLLSYDRSVALATVSVNGRTISMFSTHLDHQYSSKRVEQVTELKAWAVTFAQPRVIAGDFNWFPGVLEIDLMLQGYYDAWAEAARNGTAVAYPANPNGNTRNNRIDYVFYSKGATSLVLKGAQVFDTGGVSDHKPVVTTFEILGTALPPSRPTNLRIMR